MLKKGLKAVLWTLLVLIVLLGGTTGMALYWVFTPERLTPLIQKQLKSVLLCDTKIGSVSLKLFSGYELASLEIQDLVLRKQVEGGETDTILSAKRCYMQVDWMRWWKTDELVVQEISLEKPGIYFFVNAKGQSNWDIFPADTAVKKEETPLKMPFKEAGLPLFSIADANLHFQDRVSATDARLKALDMKVKAGWKADRIQAKIDLKIPEMIVKLGGDAYWKGDPLELLGEVEYDMPIRKLNIAQLQLRSAPILLDLKGSAQADSLFSRWDLNVRTKLSVNDLGKALLRIPASMAAPLKGIKLKGEAVAEGRIRGTYDSLQLPSIDVKVRVSCPYVSAPQMPDVPVEDLVADLSLKGDLDQPEALQAELYQFRAKALSSRFFAKGQLSRLSDQMCFRGDLDADLHMENISRHFLDTMGYPVKGQVALKAVVDLSVDALTKMDWKNIRVSGNAHYTDLNAESCKDSIAFRSTSGDMSLLLHPEVQGPEKWFLGLKAAVKNAEVSMQGKKTASFDHFELDALTSNFMDTTAQLEAAVKGLVQHIRVPQHALQFMSPPNELQIPEVSVDMRWTPELSELKDARIAWMGSDVRLSGQMKHFSSYLLGKEKLWGRMNLHSERLNLGELIALANQWGQQDTLSNAVKPKAAVKDSSVAEVSSGPLMVPKDMDMELHVTIQEALYGLQKWDHIQGAVTLKDGKMLLDRLKLNMPAGHVQLTALYRSPRKNHLFAGFDFHMVEVEIEELIKMIPDVDSIMPMLRSFSGKAEFHMVGETYMDSLYNLKKSTLRGAASLKGQNLVLKDGHAFTEIARTLKFSKKNRILVDSLSAELTLFKDEVDVFPFQISMENYKAVISGRHNLDMSFDYHISVTDSPLPFRLGVNVHGTMDKLKFSLAPTRYGYRYRPAQQKTVDKQVLNLRKMIKASLEEASSPE